MRNETLERIALCTVLYAANVDRNEEAKPIDPDLFTDSGLKAVAKAAQKEGLEVGTLSAALMQDNQGFKALLDIIDAWHGLAMPLSWLDSGLKPLHRLKQGRALELSARTSIQHIKHQEIDKAVDVLRRRLDEPLDATEQDVWVKGGTAAMAYMDLYNQLQAGDLPSQITTGLGLIDRVINESIGGGLHTGQIGCIAARPGRGKSTFMVWLIEAVLQKHKDERVGLFSFEMTARDIGKKITDRLLLRQVARKSAAALYGCINAYADLLQRLYIDERNGLEVEEVIAQADKMQAEGVRVFFVDYVQRVKVADVAPEAMRLAYGHVVEALTEDAKRKDRLWVILSQFSRSAEGRPGTMADLKETSAIEENAFFILGLHRPVTQQAGEGPARLHPTRLEVHVLKNRFGAVGGVYHYEADWPHSQLERAGF